MFFLRKLRKKIAPDLFKGQEETYTNTIISVKLEKNMEILKKILGDSADFSLRELWIGRERTLKGALFWFDTIVDRQALQESIIEPLTTVFAARDHIGDGFEIIRNQLTTGEIKTAETFPQLCKALLQGYVALLLDGREGSLLLQARDFKSRSIGQPEIEVGIKGPRASFTEDLGTNISLVRRLLKNESLKIEAYELGTMTLTDVRLLYLKNQVNPAVLQEVKTRLEKFTAPIVLDSSYLQEALEDAHLSIFPTIAITERPDTLVSHLLEGGVALLVDGSPQALRLPMTFFMHFQAAEDYYVRYPIATFVRLLRLVGVLFSLLLPSIYVAVISFHPELLPPSLLLNIVANRADVPFPPIFEAALMELIFEGLREAALRMPRPIGSAISIVGALILGEAAIQAGIVSPPMVVIVAGTAIASFITSHPDMSSVFRILRFLFLILASVLGFIGVFMGIIGIHIHLCSLRSFGLPYMSPLAPANFHDMADIFLRKPHWLPRTFSPMLAPGRKLSTFSSCKISGGKKKT